ncbi:hypothetical protein TYRP_010781 [Tyrophagus putrescentiae]|nr:hypothetical protein TYRP_010781 [Tyrophagus putrescentiae]
MATSAHHHHHHLLSSSFSVSLFAALLCLYFTVSLQLATKNPSVLIEGCIDDGCLSILTSHYKVISKCFDPLRESIPPEEEEYSLKLCCNVAKYEKCIFPYIISYCGMDSLDKFDAELKSINSQCTIATLQWSKCEVNKTAVPEAELDLRE